MTTHPGFSSEHAAQAIVRAYPATGPMTAPGKGTHMHFTRRPAAWFVVVALAALAMLIPRGRPRLRTPTRGSRSWARRWRGWTQPTSTIRTIQEEAAACMVETHSTEY